MQFETFNFSRDTFLEKFSNADRSIYLLCDFLRSRQLKHSINPRSLYNSSLVGCININLNTVLRSWYFLKMRMILFTTGVIVVLPNLTSRKSLTITWQAPMALEGGYTGTALKRALKGGYTGTALKGALKGGYNIERPKGPNHQCCKLRNFDCVRCNNISWRKILFTTSVMVILVRNGSPATFDGLESCN